MQIQIVIPLWNEAQNISALVQMLKGSPLVTAKTLRFVLVNNGSSDNSTELLSKFCQGNDCFEILNLPTNQNYGGGILEGLKKTSAPFIGFIPGDLQVHISDVERVWKMVEQSSFSEKTVFKGLRTVRMDGMNTRFVSKAYTMLANLILNIKVKDINGLPKVFHRRLLENLAPEVMKTFVLDAQLLATAYHHGWSICEVPVTFHARREGVSSWSGKRFRVYFQSIKMLFRIRRKKLSYRQRLDN